MCNKIRFLIKVKMANSRADMMDIIQQLQHELGGIDDAQREIDDFQRDLDDVQHVLDGAHRGLDGLEARMTAMEKVWGDMKNDIAELKSLR